MNHKDFYGIRRTLALSTKKLGKMLLVDGRTVRRWETDPKHSDHREVSGPAQQLMALLALGIVTKDDLRPKLRQRAGRKIAGMRQIAADRDTARAKRKARERALR